MNWRKNPNSGLVQKKSCGANAWGAGCTMCIMHLFRKRGFLGLFERLRPRALADFHRDPDHFLLIQKAICRPFTAICCFLLVRLSCRVVSFPTVWGRVTEVTLHTVYSVTAAFLVLQWFRRFVTIVTNVMKKSLFLPVHVHRALLLHISTVLNNKYNNYMVTFGRKPCSTRKEA